MVILVTGGAGYIGSHMVHALVDRGDDVVVLDNLSTGHKKAIPEAVPLVVGDTGDAALVSDLIVRHGVDAVVHFAASIVVPESIANPLAYYKNNTANSRTLIDVAIKSGVRYFIFSSTAAIYGNPDTVPVPETATPHPMSPYGTSKLMTEWMLSDAAAAHELRYAVLRYFNVAGGDPQLRTGQSTKAATHLIKVAVQTALGQRTHMEVYGSDYPTPDGTCIRDYVHVSDLVQAHVSALAYLRQGGDSVTLNCGYGRGYSVLDVVNAVKRVSGTEFPVLMKERRPGDPAAIVARVDRVRELLAWNPSFDSLDVIVEHALAWERKLAEEQGA